MDVELDEFAIEFVFTPASDTNERLSDAYDLILSLILQELQPEKKDGEECSTPSD